MNKTVLVVGGTSGLGLSLASLFARRGCNVFVTGRKDPARDGVQFHELELDTDTLATDLDMLLASLPQVDTIIYAAGFYQEARIAELSDADILKMDRVGLLAPMLLMAKLVRKQDYVPEFIAITSTSQWTPRELEPTYSAVKAGLGMLSHSLSLDPAIGKVLVIGVAGMATPFWKATGRDVVMMLHPDWVAGRVLEQLVDQYEYRFAKILRNPPRVLVAESQ